VRHPANVWEPAGGADRKSRCERNGDAFALASDAIAGSPRTDREDDDADSEWLDRAGYVLLAPYRRHALKMIIDFRRKFQRAVRI